VTGVIGRMTCAAAVFGLVLCAAATAGPVGEAQHGLSVFGDLKYGPEFEHFDYVNAGAPKGGEIKLSAVGSFDSINPFILKGEVENYLRLNLNMVFDSLMAPAGDEPDSFYGLIAESVALARDRSSILYTLRDGARWHDGAPITAADVTFSFESLKTHGHPRFRLIYSDIETAEAVGANKVRFHFKAGAENRDLPSLTANMPVFSKTFFATHEFDKTTLQPILGSGPYRMDKVDAGRSITYARVPDYWARDLPVNRGRYNFDHIRIDYYRDREIDMEAFKAHAYDFREEFTSKIWATAYEFPARARGLVVRETLPDERPSGTQAFFLNTRRDKFRDPRVREALGYAFDFEWTNKNIFYGQYKRTRSMFENSPMAARELPSTEETALLQGSRDRLPPEVFTTVYDPPATDGSGKLRQNLRTAHRLLREAGWMVEDGQLRNAAGEALEIEFLIDQPTFERVIGPFIRNLERLGIASRIRLVDSAQYQSRLEQFDYDVITARFIMSLTPGIEQRNMWGSNAAALPGSFNLSGIADAAVDALIEEVIVAADRNSLITAVRALDRVLMWNHYVIPQWFKAAHNIAYWNIFGRPTTKPRYSPGYPDTWWYDEAKARALGEALGDSSSSP
jgi:microcin C transport system substrate-binding protein